MQEHTGPTVGYLKHLERLGRGWQLICLVCSAVSEAFGAARTLSDTIQHAKSEEVCCRTSETLDTLIDGVLANQRGVWEGRNTVCALVFYALCSIISCFHVLVYWHETTVIMSAQDKLIRVHLLMPRCMFSTQLFLSEIVKFCFDQK